VSELSNREIEAEGEVGRGRGGQRKRWAEAEAASTEMAEVTGKCNNIKLSHYTNHMFSLLGRKKIRYIFY